MSESSRSEGGNNGDTSSEVGNKHKSSVAFVVLGVIIGVALVAAGLFIWNRRYISSEGGTGTITPTVEATPTAAPAPEPSPVELPANKGTLMADPNKSSSIDNDGSYPAFGTSYERKDISSIYFLDSLDDAPKNSIDISEEQNGSVQVWFEPDANGLYKMYIAGNNGVTAPTDCEKLFKGYTLLQKIEFYDAFDTSNVTDMSGMFYGCEALTALDVSGFDTSNVTGMDSMFTRCESLTTLDLSGFNTSNLTDMSWMFDDCESLTTLDVSSFDTSSVTDMSWMFDSCKSLTTLDVSGFHTGRVESMGFMFGGCISLKSLDVSGFATGNVTDMGDMFFACESLTTLDVSGFDTSNVTNMRSMFYGCESLTTLDVSGFNTSKMTDMSDMFTKCNAVIIGREKFPDAE